MTTLSNSGVVAGEISDENSGIPNSDPFDSEWPPMKDENNAGERRFPVSTPPTSPNSTRKTVRFKLHECSLSKTTLSLHRGKVDMILNKIIMLEQNLSDSTLREKTGPLTKSAGDLDEIKTRLQSLKKQQNSIKKHIETCLKKMEEKQNQSASDKMNMTLLSNQLESLGDKLESMMKTVAPFDVDILLNEREALRKTKDSEIQYLQDELARVRKGQNSIATIIFVFILLLLVIAVLVSIILQMRFWQKTYIYH